MHHVVVANGDMSSLHCRMHGKDFSDCIVYHFNWQYKCASRRNAFGAIIREAVQGRWGIPVQLRAYGTPRNSLENQDEGDSVADRHEERAATEVAILRTSLLPSHIELNASYARESEFLHGLRCNWDKLCNDSASTTATACGTSCGREEANEAKVHAVEDHLKFLCNANDSGSSNAAASSCGYQEAESYNRESETSTCAKRMHGDTNFNHTEQRTWKFIGDGADPLEVIGWDLMHKVFSSLDALSLSRCGAVSKNWLTLAQGDDLWQRQCNILWENKVHFPLSALRATLTKMEAYAISVKESKRTKITRKDLCDHAWEFRFKEVAPDYWLSLDPSWQGQAPMQRYFHADGSQTAGPNDAVWGGHECRYYLIDIPPNRKKSGRYVRINHWPIMTVSRTENWGWELSNEIYFYKSVPDHKNLAISGDPVNENRTFRPVNNP